MILACSCGKKLRVPDGSTGTARCPACKAHIPIPAAEPEPLPPPPPPRPKTPSASAPPRSRPRPNDEDDDRPRREGAPPADGEKLSSPLPLILGGCALILVLGCGGAVGGYFAFFHDRSPPADPSAPQADRAVAPTREFNGHTNKVTGLAFSADGTRLASAAADGTLRLWDASTGVAEKTMRPGPAQQIDVVWMADNRIATLCQGNLQRWRIETGEGELVQGPFGVGGTPSALAGTPTGWGVGRVGRMVEVFEPRGGGELSMISGGVSPVPRPKGAAFTPDGKGLVAVSEEGGGAVWIVGGSGVAPHGRAFKHVVPDPTGVAVMRNGHIAVSTARFGVQILDPTSLDLVGEIGDFPKGMVPAVAAGAKAKHLAASADNGVRFYDPDTRTEAGRVTAPAGVTFRATCLAYSPDGKKLAAGGGNTFYDSPNNYIIYLWDVAAMTPKKD